MVVRETCGNEYIATFVVSPGEQTGTYDATVTAPSPAEGSDL
ncbi:MAG: hypothetical protein ACTHJJ_01065 [Intrasporangium sp.]